MTQEEKLEEAKRLYETANADQKYVLESLFPELKESEDERIRKELLDFCKNRAENFPNDPKYKNISAWIAWLEKQGEQKDILEDAILDSNEDGLIAETIGIKQGEQKPAWSEEDDRMYNIIVSFIPQHLTAESYTACINWLKSLRPQNTWKPSDEQMEMVDKIINALSRMQLFGGRNALIDLKHDLEKLREE